MNRRLLALYPRSWRERYGSEVASLADELVNAGEVTPLRAALDLVVGAAVERCRVLIRREVLLPLAAGSVVMGGVALAVSRAQPGTGATRPYFATHPVGVLLQVAELVWLLMELAEWWRGRRSRRLGDGYARRGQRRFGLAVGACVVAGTLSINLAPVVVPIAQIQPGVVAFAAGVVMLTAGLGLRRWSFRALRGRYLNFSVVVNLDQPVVTGGPYRLLRHPGNAGMLLICAGIGLTSANWAGLAAMTLSPLAVIVWRIRAEERVLLSSPGGHYRRYASDRKRLVPLIW
jgi:protein-S-isoprenylcysteine O-methyltransferase Ste14